MQDCMVQSECLRVRFDIENLTLTDGSTQFLAAGTYLDAARDAAVLAALPQEALVRWQQL
jgi:hypothetical protein